MAATNSECDSKDTAQKPSFDTFQLFSSSANSAFGIFDDVSQQAPAIPPPPCIEVLASDSEVGCGQGLPGIYALLEGAAAVHFQDFNAEVLRCLTIPNVDANISERSQPSPPHLTNDKAEVRYFAGDWSEIDKLLPHVGTDANHIHGSGYDFILMAETVYSINSLQNLYNLIKKCLLHPHGVVYMAAKKYYFGVGGGTRRFLSVVEKDGVMTSSLVAEITDGSSNVREVWKLTFK